MKAIEKAWKKYEERECKRLGAKAKAAVKATFMDGYMEGVKNAATLTRDLVDDSFDAMSEAGRAAHWAKVSSKQKGGD